MLVTVRARKDLGRVLGAAVILCAVIPGAAIADCSDTTKKQVADTAKVEVKNSTKNKTFFADFYKKKYGDADYGDSDESVTVKPGNTLHHDFGIPENHGSDAKEIDKNTVNIKVVLTAEWQDSPGITEKKVVSVCEYTVHNEIWDCSTDPDGNEACKEKTEWNWTADNNCSKDNLADFCENCKIICEKQFTSPSGSNKPHWSTKFTLEEG